MLNRSLRDILALTKADETALSNEANDNSIPRDKRPEWIPTRRLLQWKNGAVAQVFSAEDPESLRGPQFSATWLDELAKWRHAEAVRLMAAKLTLGVAPKAARDVIQAIADSKKYPQAMDAGMCLWALNQGISKPS